MSSVSSELKKSIVCANCGTPGHVYKTCNHPIISYGFICYRIVKERINILMVQRKDSLCYVEFMRGKYDINNKTYIMHLISNMTEEERFNIVGGDFVVLWNELWCKDSDSIKSYNKEFIDARLKFNQLQRGYYLRNGNDLLFFDLKYCVMNTVSLCEESEWGFPKGRRNANESDMTCALRELKEETGMDSIFLNIKVGQKPFEEIFSGTNNKRYKHVYYIAEITSPNVDLSINPSCKEIKCVKWFDIDDAYKKIRDINVERKELLKRLELITIREREKN